MRVLIIDDDGSIRRFTARALAERGIECASAASYAEARAILDAQGCDLILLDILLEHSSGWEALMDLRARGDETPVIILSGLHTVDERVRGLNMGADDFVQKPFESDELIARVEAVVRRRNAIPVLKIGRLRVDLERRTVDRGDVRIDVSPREFEVLAELIRAEGRVVSKLELLHRLWGLDHDPQTKVVEVQVARLRRKLEPEAPNLIETVVGGGYRISVTRERQAN